MCTNSYISITPHSIPNDAIHSFHIFTEEASYRVETKLWMSLLPKPEEISHDAKIPIDGISGLRCVQITDSFTRKNVEAKERGFHVYMYVYD